MTLPFVDIAVLIIYLLGIVIFGCLFVRKSRTTDHFMAAGRALPGWAVGLSIFGTYLSSNTFIGVPGKAFGGNWNSFTFSLSLPIAAFIGVKFFIPFYRRSGEISAYHHLENRFGPWARTYAALCYLLSQIGRMGSIMFGVSLALHALLGWDIKTIIIASGILVTLYTLMGGIEAVIWTDVIQSIILTLGAVIIIVMVLVKMPGGPGELFAVAHDHGKFSLGSFGPSLAQSTFWVVLVYGIFINLNNFGIDQGFVQRYHTAKTDGEARKSLYLGSLVYIPVSLAFFFIGTALFSFYHEQPELLSTLKERAVALSAQKVGDQALPHFMVHMLPPGLTGLLVAALAAAAMSSIDTSLNSMSTVALSDIYKRYFRKKAGEKESMRVLYAATLLWGCVGTSVALAMIGEESVLDAWWQWQGIFAGAMLGLFLLGLISRKAKNPAAVTGVIIGLLVIAWMTFTPEMEGLPKCLRSPFHANMIMAVGTLTIFLVGLIVTALFNANKRSEHSGDNS